MSSRWCSHLLPLLLRQVLLQEWPYLAHLLFGKGDFPHLALLLALHLCKAQWDEVLGVVAVSELLLWNRSLRACLLARLLITFLLVVRLLTLSLTAFARTRLWAFSPAGDATQCLCNQQNLCHGRHNIQLPPSLQ